MKRLFFGVLLTMFASTAFAQQKPDLAFVQRAASAFQAQRNEALDGMAICLARETGSNAELESAKKRIIELEKLLAEKKE